MVFLRNWDESCPRVWDSWRAGDVTWVIRDLPPEDDEEALKILAENMCTDETLCSLLEMVKDPVSMKSAEEFWRGYLAQRMSLGCYEEKDGRSKLVALNVCYVSCRGDEDHVQAEGHAWKNVLGAMKYCFDRVDAFQILGVDKVLSACGLVVHRDYRGMKLGYRLLAAREPLACHHCILGTSTVFSCPAAQRSAEKAGLFTTLTVTLKQLADAGLDFPEDEDKCLKVMMRKYNYEVKELFST